MKINVYKNQYGWYTIASNEYRGQEYKCYPKVFFRMQPEPNEEKAYIKIIEGRLGAYHDKKLDIDQPNVTVFKWEYAKTKQEEEKADTSGLNWY